VLQQGQVQIDSPCGRIQIARPLQRFSGAVVLPGVHVVPPELVREHRGQWTQLQGSVNVRTRLVDPPHGEQISRVWGMQLGRIRLPGQGPAKLDLGAAPVSVEPEADGTEGCMRLGQRTIELERPDDGCLGQGDGHQRRHSVQPAAQHVRLGERRVSPGEHGVQANRSGQMRLGAAGAARGEKVQLVPSGEVGIIGLEVGCDP
jgi:hypothetical protein